MAFKAVLFDLDGTLLDTLQDIADATNIALKQEGFPVHDIPTYRHFMGEGMATLAFKSLPESHREPDTINRLLSRIVREYSMRWTKNTKPYPGISELLDALTIKGIKMAILSNKKHKFAILQVKKLLPKWHFDAVFGESAATPRKPEPTGALRISKILKISPAEFLYPGDTTIDVKTAIAAGMYPIGVLWGFQTRIELLAAGAKTIIEQPRDLLALLS